MFIKRESSMFYALSWFVVFALLALWSLGAWAFHAIAVWAVSNAGVFTGAASGVDGLRRAGLAGPLGAAGDRAGDDLAALGPGAFSSTGLLQAAPALAGGLTRGDLGDLGPRAACCLSCWGPGLHLLIALWLPPR